MASRFENRAYGPGRKRRGEYGDRPSEYGRGQYGPRDFAGGYSDYGRDEGYFGGGRQSFGEGYTGGSAGREYGEWTGGYGRGRGESYYGGQDYGYERDYPGRRLTGGEYGGSRREYERDLGGGGMIGGGFGGYTGGGYQGYTGGGYREGRGPYGAEYPESERGYATGRGGYSDEERGWFDRASDEVSSWFGDEEAERRREMDARRSGLHRGRGPRSYTRSDDRIKEDINDRLTDNDFLDATDIDVEVKNGDVTLSGTVDSRYSKRMAEDIAEDVTGVKNVENRIRVGETTWGRGTTEARAATTGTTGTARTTTGTSATGTTGRTTETATGTTGTTTAKTRGRAAGA